MKTSDRLSYITANIQAIQRLNWQDISIDSVTDDSREVRDGAIFVAVSGENTDGHDYIPEALRNGASAIVCETPPSPLPACPVIRVKNSRRALSSLAARIYPSGMVRKIGVTGTDGKTTTTELIRSILEQTGERVGSLGTIKYNLGTRSVDSLQTTPHPIKLHSMLAEMQRAGLRHAVMEVSSHALVHHRTADVSFDIAVLTNITEDHLDFHGSRQAYKNAKKMLFEQLHPGALAVLNADSEVCRDFAMATRAPVLTYGMKNKADVKLLERKMDIEGTDILVQTPLDTYAFRTPLIGDYNCENILAAITAAFALGIPKHQITKAIEQFSGTGGRLEKISVKGKSKNMPAVFVDYAHTASALKKVIATLKPLVSGQLICVFGCGGDRETQKRPLMGRVATEIADLSIITADNSRSENTEDIIRDITAGINKSARRYIKEPDRKKAIKIALDSANSPDDAVVICGRGCERYQVMNGRKIPFDDRTVTRQLMEQLSQRTRKTA
jgi:UDP-N-acetylmuramoyl-L-alanyl-D-glutamate--2,6-diaminopimelate ligase